MGLKGALVLLSVVASVTSQMDSTQKIESFHVVSDIRYRFATTQMESVVRNTANYSQEIRFDVTLPKEAFIMHFAMSIDGKVYEGEVKEKQAAKRQYQAAVDRGQSAGHVAQSARHANLFDVSVNVASGSAVNFTLTYQELLRRKLGLYHHEIHVRPGQPVEDFLVKVFIKDKVPITLIRTPSVKKDFLISNEAGEKTPDYVSVVQRSPTTAYIEYLPSLTEQGEDGLNARFLMQYDVAHSADGDLLVVDGYFVHFFAPDLPPMPKDIIFVLDKSGSMMNDKISQLKTAMDSILKDPMPKDRFNIFSFSNNVYQWKQELAPADEDVKAEALQFVRSIGANGGTNINDALLRAVRSLQQREVNDRAPLIFFLTDGQPTAGVTDSEAIKRNIRLANEDVVSIFSLAFGRDADYDLLKGISAQNSGFARKIYVATDSAMQVSNLYEEISAVVMKNLKVSYLNSSVDEFTLTRTEFPVVFNGSEVIICGRLDNDTKYFEADYRVIKKGGEVTQRFETNNVENFVIEEDPVDKIGVAKLFNSPRDFSGIVERMWAFLNIKQMLKEREKGFKDKRKDKRIKQKIIDMAVKYKFVTPLTSMVVTKPEDSEGTEGEFKEKIESGLTDVDDVTSGGGHLQRVQSAHYSFKPRRTMGGRARGFARHHQIVRHQRKHIFDPALMSSSGGAMPGLKGLPPPRPATYPQQTNLMTNIVLPPATTPSTRRRTRPRGGRGKGRPSSGGRGRGGSRRKRRRKAKKLKLILATVVLEKEGNSYCIVPKKWPAGNYSLLQKPIKGQSGPYPVTIEVSTIKKRLNGLPAVFLEDGTRVDTTFLSRSGWQYSVGDNTQVTLVNMSTGIQLEQSGEAVLTVQIIMKTKRTWYLAVKINANLANSGDGFLKAVRKRSTRRVREWCGYMNQKFTVRGIVTGRKAQKFLFR